MRRTFLALSMLVVVAVAPSWASAAGWAPDPVGLVAPGPTLVFPAGLAFGPGGALTAAWLSGGAAADLVVADRPAGGPWGAPATLSGGASVSGVTLATNPSGAQAVAWLEGGYVRAATRPAGGPWQPVAVPLSGSGVGGAPVLAIAPNGTVAVAWVEGGQVKVSVRGTAGAFSSPTTIAGGTDPHAPAIAAGPASDILLAWADSSGAQGRLMTAYRAAGAFSFASPVAAWTVTPAANQSVYFNVPKVVFDAAGEASVVWLRALTDSAQNKTLTVWEGRWRTAGPSGTFPGAIPHDFEANTVNNTLPAPLNDGALVADASGRTSFAWPTLAQGAGLSMASRAGAGTGFGATAAVGPSGMAPRLTASAVGTSLLVVDDKSLTAAFAPAGALLGSFDEVLSPTAATTQNRSVPAGDGDGDAAVLWSARDATSAALRLSVWDAGAPEARDVAVPASVTAGASVGMSVAPWDALTGASATWDFGDGSPVEDGASVSHVYAGAGARTVTITVVDGVGNATVVTRDVVVSPTPAPPAGGGGGGGGSGAGGGGGTPSPPAPVVPRITGLKLSPATFRAKTGTKVSYTITMPATVRFTVERAGPGRSAGGTCVKPTKANQQRKACVRWVKVPGSVTRTVKAGTDRFTFKARLGSTRLKPGSYRLVATPTGSGTPARKAFKIVR
ncbi:MAG TPA: PKD domain-containing protein [Baekduia sp.]|uniref:PKD domain-containing protein n=1 Tax=Baekduia sp. TaxID=2600305 RepID=UPI002D7A38BC|nr:PKD domain-containing protein [Baekduia sp.]HET6505625.1 PKD domain-containing protein [Baekduia sp.]